MIQCFNYKGGVKTNNAMSDINVLKRNKIGVTYLVNKPDEDAHELEKKIHLVFNNTGLKLTIDELVVFLDDIMIAKETPSTCQNQCDSAYCKSILLYTPFQDLVFSVSKYDLKYLQYLVEGTLFELNLNDVLAEISVGRSVKL
ncbi:MAG: hypothetical protein HRT67_13385 [Flavobacteriaceae bacterium]|nr:hypothetical protein [Flavobacteriaceae bacterium]